MSQTMNDRREFLRTGLVVATGAVITARESHAENPVSDAKPHFATNEYPWRTFYQRDGKNFRKDLAASLAEVAAAGFDGLEPLVNSPTFLAELVPALKKHNLQMRSLYVNSTLHDPAAIKTNIDLVVAIGSQAQELAQTKIIVTNPSPIKWGSDENKTDDQLKIQAEALSQLGAKLKEKGLTLAYHNHDAELRAAAREFHHMLAGTDPANVSFCFDTHWVYRGAGNSQIALFDVLKLYADRVVELHLRQSRDGIWTEAFAMEGDIDYSRLFAILHQRDVKPLITLEQAVERGSPKTLTAREAHEQGLKNLKEGTGRG